MKVGGTIGIEFSFYGPGKIARRRARARTGTGGSVKSGGKAVNDFVKPENFFELAVAPKATRRRTGGDGFGQPGPSDCPYPAFFTNYCLNIARPKK
jgi:hypothetical protein